MATEFDYVEDELAFDREEFQFDQQDDDDWIYYIDKRDEYGRYLNIYGDINYVKPNIPDLNSYPDLYSDEKIDEFYEAQKRKLWNGKRYANYPGETAQFYLDEKTGQLFAFTSFTSKKAARLTDPKDSNKFLPLSSIALQAGNEFVRDNLGFKDFSPNYDVSNSNWYQRDFYKALIERGFDIYQTGLSKSVRFIYKKHSSNAKDFGISAQYRSKEVELTYRGSTSDFLPLNVIAKKFGKEGVDFVRKVLGVKDFGVKKIMINIWTLNLEKISL